MFSFKRHLTNFLLVALLFVQASACSSDGGDSPEIPPPPPGSGIDETLDCKSPQDVGAYATFYKPQTGWVGDPMPFYNEDDGTFYIFHLQDWRNGQPQDHPIYYTTTKDYGTFIGFYEAIPCGPTEQSQDVFLGTGSFIKRNGICYGFYTGHNGRLQPREKIMLATSTDMRTWNKQPDFTFQAPAGYDQNNFRDPHVYYDPYRECYVMLVTTLRNGKGCLARFTSDDLMNWTNIEPLTDFESDAEILECPDIFEMGGKWYLMFSRINRDKHRKTFYRVADTPEGPWRIVRDDAGHHETLDGLFMYAGKTASDGTNRYVSGWCSSDERVNNSNELGWAGSLVSHRLVQQPSGRLYPVIAEGVNKKFSTTEPHKAILTSGSVSETNGQFTIGANGYAVFNRNGSSFKITMTIDAANSQKFGIALGACDTQDDVYKLEFDLTNNESHGNSLYLYNNGQELNFNPLQTPDNKKFTITLVAEKTVCTLYVNNQIAFTNRIFKMHQNPWMIYATQGSAVFSDIKVYK